jgi:hypothetical protein
VAGEDWRHRVSRVRNPLGGSGLALEVDDVLAITGANLNVFSAHDPSGSRYLVAHTSGQGRAGTWLCAPVTERALACVQSGRAELRDVFAHSATGAVEKITVSTKSARRPKFHESLRLCTELTNEELPEPGVRLGLPARCA